MYYTHPCALAWSDDLDVPGASGAGDQGEPALALDQDGNLRLVEHIGQVGYEESDLHRTLGRFFSGFLGWFSPGDLDPDFEAVADSLGLNELSQPVRTRFGYQYADMEVTVNDELLDRVARTTGGLYFRATDPEALTRIYRRIDELETVPVEEVRLVERAGVRTELLILALVALALELIGSATRARRVFA